MEPKPNLPVKFIVKHIIIPQSDIFLDNKKAYYITIEGMYILGDPLTKDDADTICNWMNTVSEEDLTFQREHNNDD